MKLKIFNSIFFLLLLLSAQSFAAPWKVLQYPSPSQLYGKVPLDIEKVYVTNEQIKNDIVYYTYKLIIRRPSGDNGWGVAYLNPMKYRLHYWAATTGTNPMTSIHMSTGVYQETHKDPRKIVVHLLQGLRPGNYKISVAIFPYPMYENYSFKDIIQFARGPYVSFLFDLKKALAATSPAAAALVFVGSQAKTQMIDGALIRIANKYGERIELEVLAKMPKITTRYAKDAAHLLKMRNLVPAPDHSHPIPTKDKRYDGRVAKCQYAYGDWLKAGTVVPYKFYKYSTHTNQNVTVSDSVNGDILNRLGNHFYMIEDGMDASCDRTGQNTWKCKYASGTIAQLTIRSSGNTVTMKRTDIKSSYKATAEYKGTITNTGMSGTRIWRPKNGNSSSAGWSIRF